MQTNLSSPTLTARAIGYAGLIPFIGLSAMSVLWRDIHHSAVLFSLLAYGATIISFLGAIHWGLAIQFITLWICFLVDYKRYPKIWCGPMAEHETFAHSHSWHLFGFPGSSFKSTLIPIFRSH